MELKGASLAWAPKDKSSKKHVLEVSGGGGEKEKGLSAGLELSRGKPPEEGPGDSWGCNSQGSKLQPHPPQGPLRSGSGIVDSAVPSPGAEPTSPWPWREGRGRGL